MVKQFVLIIASLIATQESALASENYTAKKGNTLFQVINEWSNTNHYELVWNVKDSDGDAINWKITHDVSVKGSYVQAVGQLLDTYKSQQNPINFNWTFYKNKVLVITLEEPLK